MANEGIITQNDLRTRFRAAGVYTVYRDLTASPVGRPLTILRLVPGFSKFGIFNAPVFIEQNDFSTAERIYGKRDKSLERKGSWFHKSLEVSLEEGPVLALNLLKTNNEVDINGVPTANADVVPYISLSADVADKNSTKKDKLYASYFDKSRFWKPSRSYLLATRSGVDNGFLLNFTNLSQKAITVIVRKSTVRGYDIPVKEWYANIDEEIPSYLNPSDLISDYFIDVIVVAGDYSNYQQLAIDPIFGQYFNTNGIIISELNAFLGRTDVKTINIYTGSLITNFRDTNGVSQYIEEIVNRDVVLNGLLCAVDRNELDKYDDNTNTKFLDLVGHRLITTGVTDLEYLSYKKDIAEDFLFTENFTNATDTVDTAAGYSISYDYIKKVITVTVTSTNADFASLTNQLQLGSLFEGVTTIAGATAGITITNPSLEVVRLSKSATSIVFDVTSPLKDGENGLTGSFVDLLLTLGGDVTYDYTSNTLYRDSTDTYYIAEVNTDLYDKWASSIISNGDTINDGTQYYVKFTEVRSDGSYDFPDDYRKLLIVELFTDSALTVPITVGNAPAFGTTFTASGVAVTDPTKLVVSSLAGTLNVRRTINSTVNAKTVRLPIADEQFVKAGYRLVGVDQDGNLFLTRIVSIKRVGTPIPTEIDVECYDEIKLFTNALGSVQVEIFKPIESVFDTYNVHSLRGFTLKTSHMPNGTNQRMTEILSVMTDTKMFDALVDPEMINWRYYIDTFNHGLEPQSKRYLTRLFKTRQRCLGLLNCPTVEEFTESTNPRFTDSPTSTDPLPSLNVEYINVGGNLDENPTFLYTLPEETDGASFAGYLFPNISVRESNGDISSVPPSAYVGNNFIRKFRGGNPFKAVAGSRRGVITGDGVTGVDYQLTSDDRGALEEKGINPIITKNGQVQVYGNETAYKRFNSTLNNLNARDTLITLQIDIESILDGYIFEFNDDTLRSEVSTLIRNYLESVKNGFGGIVTYDVIFDRNNNPAFVANEGAAIVDVVVELTGVVKKFINRITLRRESSPASGGFVSV
jgi:hypothetical protein